jgi:hypothetical protein
MGQIAQILRAVRHPPQAGACDGAREPERPVSFAEITAASAFLDFGGVPDGPWPHAGRSPQAAVFDGTASSTARFAGSDPEQQHCGRARRKKNNPRPPRLRACCMQNSQPEPFPLSGRKSQRYVFSR